jgi:hypothetical protein
MFSLILFAIFADLLRYLQLKNCKKVAKKTNEIMNIKIVLDTRSKNKDGKHPVKIRFHSSQKSVYVSMSMFAFQEEWDENNYFLLKNKETREKYKRNNSILLKELERAEDLLNDLGKKGIRNPRPAKFKELFLAGTKQTPNFLEYFESITNKQVGRTVDVYSYTLRKLKKYVKTTLFFEDINLAWLQDFEKHLQKIGNSVNTIAIDFRNIRAVYCVVL